MLHSFDCVVDKSKKDVKQRKLRTPKKSQKEKTVDYFLTKKVNKNRNDGE